MTGSQGVSMRKQGDGLRQVEVCTHGAMILIGGKGRRPALWEQPLCRLCRLAPPLISMFPEGQSYPSEDQFELGSQTGSMCPRTV